MVRIIPQKLEKWLTPEATFIESIQGEPTQEQINKYFELGKIGRYRFGKLLGYSVAGTVITLTAGMTVLSYLINR